MQYVPVKDLSRDVHYLQFIRAGGTTGSKKIFGFSYGKEFRLAYSKGTALNSIAKEVSI